MPAASASRANLAESYRWFALAAANGDSDAAKKRDEVAARLDQQTLAAAKLAAQTFAPEREPDEATNLKAPPGGWDRTPAAPAKPRRQIRDVASSRVTGPCVNGALNKRRGCAVTFCVDIRAIEPIPKGSELPRWA